MKLFRCLLLLLVAAAVAWMATGCTTVSEKITAPDGTVTERTTQTVDAAAFTAGANAVTVIAAPRIVRAEKSAPCMRGVLRNRQPRRMALDGPITTEEVEMRWKPVNALAR